MGSIIRIGLACSEFGGIIWFVEGYWSLLIFSSLGVVLVLRVCVVFLLVLLCDVMGHIEDHSLSRCAARWTLMPSCTFHFSGKRWELRPQMSLKRPPVPVMSCFGNGAVSSSRCSAPLTREEDPPHSLFRLQIRPEALQHWPGVTASAEWQVNVWKWKKKKKSTTKSQGSLKVSGVWGAGE